MPYYRSLANAYTPKAMAPIKGERPPPHWKRYTLLTALLILHVTLLLIVSLCLFVSFENQANSPELNLIPQAKLLNKTRPRSNYLDGLIASLHIPLALSPAESRLHTRSGQVLVRVSDVTKIVAMGVTTGRFHDPLTNNRPLPKSLIAWYVHYHRYLADEEKIEA